VTCPGGVPLAAAAFYQTGPEKDTVHGADRAQVVTLIQQGGHDRSRSLVGQLPEGDGRICGASPK